jgi:hypothetical protein
VESLLNFSSAGLDPVLMLSLLLSPHIVQRSDLGGIDMLTIKNSFVLFFSDRFIYNIIPSSEIPTYQIASSSNLYSVS